MNSEKFEIRMKYGFVMEIFQCTLLRFRWYDVRRLSVFVPIEREYEITCMIKTWQRQEQQIANQVEQK